MLTVSEALAAILREVQRFAPSSVALGESLGLVLAEDAVSTLDSPPFDKALMDGYAVRSACIAGESVRLRVIEDVMAGQVPQRSVEAGQATRIMTGAPLPQGADAVIPVEHTQIPQDAPHDVQIETQATTPGRNILRRGSSCHAGDRLIPAGRLLRAQEVGCLAELGCARVAVYRRPRVAILATGDELVPVGSVPGPGQIRNSNETMLAAQVKQSGGEAVPLGIARDNRRDLDEKIAAGLECDVLLLSGGVSAGVLDLVPAALGAAGVRQVFHKVRVKPGQPLWYGVLPDRFAGSVGPAATRCHVFGLPGNPVSSMVCFELFTRTALRQLMGQTPAEPVALQARLLEEHEGSGNRPTYHPARLEFTATGTTVQLVRWIGSSDLSGTVEANAMALIPPGEQTYAAGTLLDVIPW